MPDADYRGLTDDQKKSLSAFKTAEGYSGEYCRPYFDKFVRFYKLFAGEMPPELDSTFSKIMLWFAYAMVEKELPTSTRMFFTTNWFDLEARDPMDEMRAQDAKKWMRYQLESVQQLPSRIVPTLQSTHIFGNGFRFYGHKSVAITKKRRVYDEEMGMPYNFRDQEERIRDKSIIYGQDTSVFNVMPSPGGGLINDYDKTNDRLCDYMIVYTYPSKSALEEMAQHFDKNQLRRMFDGKQASDDDPTLTYKDALTSTQSGWSRWTEPQWVKTMRDENFGAERRYKLSWFMGRKHWKIIGDNAYLLYDGPPFENCIPLAHFKGSYDLSNFYGFGLVEPVEDLIISICMNFNHRQDYLAGTLHPSTFVPQELLDDLGGSKGMLDPQPYQIIPYSHIRFDNIATQVWRDRFPELNQQAFVDEDKMRMYIQEMVGQTDMGRGIQPTRVGDIGATGIMGLISAGAARSIFRAVNIEHTGIRDSMYLTLKFGDKYIQDADWIRQRGGDGFPWSQVEKEAITDEYDIVILGSRSLNQSEETFRQMLSIAPFVMQNPTVRNQMQATKDLMEKATWPNPENKFGGGEPMDVMSMPMAQEGAPAGMGGAPVMQNNAQAMQGAMMQAPGAVGGAPLV